MKIKKIILLTIGAVIFSGLLFAGGFYYGWNKSLLNKQIYTITNCYVSSGYGTIVRIDGYNLAVQDVNNVNRFLPLSVTKWTGLYKVVSSDDKSTTTEKMKFEDLKVGDKVFYNAAVGRDAKFYLLTLNVK